MDSIFNKETRKVAKAFASRINQVLTSQTKKNKFDLLSFGRNTSSYSETITESIKIQINDQQKLTIELETEPKEKDGG